MTPVNTLAWNRLRYTLYAPFYDLSERLLGVARRRAHEQISIQPGERILLTGCGTGLDLDYIPHGVEIVAIDLSPTMVNKCKARADKLELTAQVKVMNAEQLAFESNQFDVVILHLIVAITPDPVLCMKEAARVLKPTGRISIFDKFLPAGERPSISRRALNLITNPLFSDITRSLEPLVESAGLYISQDRQAMFGGAYRIVIAEELAHRASNNRTAHGHGYIISREIKGNP